jgi:hypothetical protein
MIANKLNIYRSECGGYLCRSIDGFYEAWTADGATHWKNDNRVQTREDAEKFNRPLKYSVGSYSCERAGQKKGSFTLGLLHCNTRKKIKPFTGNTIIEQREVVFRRRLPFRQTPHWFKSALTKAQEPT